MDLLHFTTESYAEVDRLRAWSEALDRHGLRCGVPQAAARPLHGTIKSRKSTSGFELIALAAFAQTIELKVDGADSLVIVLHLDGGVTLVADGVRAGCDRRYYLCVVARGSAPVVHVRLSRVRDPRAPLRHQRTPSYAILTACRAFAGRGRHRSRVLRLSALDC